MPKGYLGALEDTPYSLKQLTADFDYNKVTQTSDKFDPEGRVLRSSQTREETLASSEAREGQVTVGNELPGAQGQQPGQQPS